MASQFLKCINESTEPPLGLFDNIICVIKQENEFKQTKRLLGVFLFLLVASIIGAPFSWAFFANQLQSSGFFYFIFAALANSNIFFMFWQDFTLSILESIPVIAAVLLMLNMALLLFSVRLFLHRKGALLKYLHYGR